MTQADLLTAVLPSDSHVVAPGEVKRLAGQNVQILCRLQQGPATRDELSAIGRNVTARVSDLRRAGYDVRCIEHNRTTGFSRYALVERGK